MRECKLRFIVGGDDWARTVPAYSKTVAPPRRWERFLSDG
jgi:hypothetical protein